MSSILNSWAHVPDTKCYARKENCVVDKKYKYQTLILRIDQAIEDEFFLEATWIAYAILEDRLVSVLRESGADPTIRMLGPKLIAVQSKTQQSINMRKAFFGDMLDRLKAWKDKRNDLMHALADERQDIPDIDQAAQSVAIEGRDLAREFAAACRRFKKINNNDDA